LLKQLSVLTEYHNYHTQPPKPVAELLPLAPTPNSRDKSSDRQVYEGLSDPARHIGAAYPAKNEAPKAGGENTYPPSRVNLSRVSRIGTVRFCHFDATAFMTGSIRSRQIGLRLPAASRNSILHLIAAA
jgi:hypothetical protein